MLKITPQELCILVAFHLLLPQCLLILAKKKIVMLETSPPTVDPLLFTSFLPSDQLVLCIMSPQNKRFHRLMEALGHCIKLCDKGRDSLHHIVRLFSLHHQDDDEDRETSKQLILLHYVKTGKVEFPTYMVVKIRLIFSSRDDLMWYAYCV